VDSLNDWLSSFPRRIAAYWRFYLYFIGTLLLDQWTKYWIVEKSGFPHGYFPPLGGIEVIEGFFSLVYITNEGAAWSLFSGYSTFLALFAVIVLLMIFFMRKNLELKKPLYQTAFGLMSAGILGNLIDRIMFGHVIDFLDFNLGFYRWPTFNIADSGIVAGMTLYLTVSSFITSRRKLLEANTLE
jgi:signal peptidase II